MAFCKHCGKEIVDGAVCDCPAALAEGAAPAADTAVEAKPAKSQNAAAITLLVLVLIVILCIIYSIAGSGFKKPIDALEKALNKCDGEILAEAMLTDDMMKEIGDDETDELNDMLDMLMEFAEEEYGDDVKFTIKPGKKEKVDKDDLEDIADNYDDDVKVSKAYEVECTMKIKGDDDKDEEEITITVVKIKGEGWKLAPDALGGVL